MQDLMARDLNDGDILSLTDSQKKPKLFSLS